MFKSPKKRYLFALIIITISSFQCKNKEVSSQAVKQGIVNITDNSEIFKLNGHWFFSRNNFLDPISVPNLKSDNVEYVHVPGAWGDKDFGYGTYFLKVKGLLNINNPAIVVGEARSAYSLYFVSAKDGNNSSSLLATVGNPSSDSSHSIPQFKKVISTLPLNLDSGYIVIHVSNYTVKNGGIKFPVYLGTSSSIYKRNNINRSINSLIIGIILFVSFHHMFLFFNLRNQKSYLLFSLYCLFMSFYVFLNNWYAYDLLNNSSKTIFTTLLKLVYLTMIIGLPFFISFLTEVFKSEFSKKVEKFYWIFSLLFLIIIFFPINIFESIFVCYQAVLLVMLIYAQINIFRAILKHRTASKISFFGLNIFFLTIIHDILLDLLIIKSIWLSSYGLLVFIICQSATISKLFGRTYKNMKYLSQNLEHEVLNKTRDLELAHSSLRKDSESKSNMFINLAHEIKTPLTIINNNLVSYMKRHSEDSEMREIKYNIDLLSDNIINFLDSEKIQRGIIVYDHNTSIDISYLLSQKLPAFVKYALDNKVTLSSKVQPVIFCKIDPFAFDRIINNLLDNAIKYNKENGSININLNSTDSKINLTVSDTGIGIEQKILPEIFDPFRQVKGKKENRQGLGMGLHITKEIIKSVGGDITVNSKPNEGTEFIITLAKSTPNYNLNDNFASSYTIPTNLSINEPIEDFISDASLPTILFVEDNRTLLKNTSENLKEDFNVLCAINGIKAIKKLNSTATLPALIISDIMMDEMDGIEFRKTVQKDDRFKDIPFIFLTARTGEYENIKGLETGALDYMVKPFSTDILKAKIKTLLNYNSLKQSLIEGEKFRSMGILTSTISHEIMNPLMGIEGPLGVLKENLIDDKIKNPQIAQQSLKFITDNLQRIQEIVETLKFMNNKIDIHEEIVLQNFLAPIIQIFKESVKEKIEVKSYITENFKFKSNGNALSQIIINLLSNAADAITENGTITISTMVQKDRKIFKISDNGCGIEKEYLPKIFEFSFTTKDQSKGTGMGLFIAKNLIDKLGMEISVESEINKGTTFTIYLND